MPNDAAEVYLGTIERMEPHITMVDLPAAAASIAISLKRIADALERSPTRETVPDGTVSVKKELPGEIGIRLKNQLIDLMLGFGNGPRSVTMLGVQIDRALNEAYQAAFKDHDADRR